MTATMHDPRTDVEIIGDALAASKLTTITIPNVDDLQRVLTNALLAAQVGTARDSRPPLQCVEITSTDGVIEVVTCDSYRLMHQTPAAWSIDGPDGHWLIHRDELAPLLAVCKTIKHTARQCEVVLRFKAGPVDQPIIEVQGAGLALTLRTFEADFPNWRQLVPAESAYTGAGAATGLGFNPRFVADLAKYRAPGRKAGDHTIKLRAQDHLKPAVWTLSGEAWCLLMPVRV